VRIDTRRSPECGKRKRQTILVEIDHCESGYREGFVLIECQRGAKLFHRQPKLAGAEDRSAKQSMTASRKRIEHDHARGIVVSALQIPLLQECKTQTQTRLDVVRVLVEELTKDLFSLFVVSFAHRAVTLGVSLLTSGGASRALSHTGECDTKHNGGHTAGRHPEKRLNRITLHDSHLPQACNCYFKTSPVFMDQRTRSSSSKSMRTSRANPTSCCSTSRYFLRVEGGLAVSITPISAKHRITCLSRIAWPFTP